MDEKQKACAPTQTIPKRVITIIPVYTLISQEDQEEGYIRIKQTSKEEGYNVAKGDI